MNILLTNVNNNSVPRDKMYLGKILLKGVFKMDKNKSSKKSKSSNDKVEFAEEMSKPNSSNCR